MNKYKYHGSLCYVRVCVCAEGVKSQARRGEGEKVTLFSYHVAWQQIDLTLPLVDYYDTHTHSLYM